MSWLTKEQSEYPYDDVLGIRPELRDLYRNFYGKLWDDDLVPANLLELCRLRIAQIHDCDTEWEVRHSEAEVSDAQIEKLQNWEGNRLFSPVEQAVLRFAEKMPWQHHEITDEDFETMRVHLSEPEVVALTVACGLFDANCRLRIALSVKQGKKETKAPAGAEQAIR